jgi:putative membrane protein
MARCRWILTFVAGMTVVIAVTANVQAGGDADQRFLAKAIAAQMAEIKLGETAVKHASSAEVKQFAQKMVEDHTKARDKMLERARELKVNVAEKPDKSHKELLDRLSQLKGQEFDREYMKIMVENHEKALENFRTGVKTLQDPALRTLINNTIPTVEAHLKHARELAKDLK